MANRQLHPLQVDPKTEEPFLQLPSPHDKIIITPYRDNDKPAIIENLNDPRITQWLQAPPNPYLQTHADWWVSTNKAVSDGVLKELEDENRTNPGGPLKTIDSCPVRSIREVQPDGTDIFIGDIEFHRCHFDDSTGEEHDRLVKENEARVVGDPDIVWSVGNYLAASHHGQGIMSAALGAILYTWLVPRHNAHVAISYTFEDNRASVRVFEKNGFKYQKTVKDCTEVQGKLMSLNVLEWRLKADL